MDLSCFVVRSIYGYGVLKEYERGGRGRER